MPPLQQVQSMDSQTEQSNVNLNNNKDSSFTLDGPDFFIDPNMPPDFSSFNATEPDSWSKFARTWAKMNGGQMPDNQGLLQHILAAMQMMQAMQQSMMSGMASGNGMGGLGAGGPGNFMAGPSMNGGASGASFGQNGDANGGFGSGSSHNAFGQQQQQQAEERVESETGPGHGVKRGGKMQKIDGRYVYVPPE